MALPRENSKGAIRGDAADRNPLNARYRTNSCYYLDNVRVITLLDAPRSSVNGSTLCS